MPDLEEILSAALGQASTEAMLGALAEARARIRELEAEVEFWRSRAEAARPAKGRSPAVWRFRVTGWEWVDVEAMVGWPRSPKTIRALRVHVPLEDQPDGPGYWDFTAKRVQAALEAMLPSLVGGRAWVEVRQVGRGPESTYTVQVIPA